MAHADSPAVWALHLVNTNAIICELWSLAATLLAPGDFKPPPQTIKVNDNASSEVSQKQNAATSTRSLIKYNMLNNVSAWRETI
jgi:hypothetical protein